MKTSQQFDGYSRVVISVSEDISYSSGTEAGRTLTLECPWGTQKMANEILEQIKGFSYHPYSASGALIDPAAELGDGVNAKDVYSGIYSQDIQFGHIFSSDISAPSEEEIDHEYPYVPKQERKVTRSLYNLTTELKVQAGLISAEVSERKSNVESINSTLSLQSGQIAAKVNKTGGSSSSFGWVLDESSWTIKANGSDVLKATQSGLEIYGKITATSGKIGGFTIESNYMNYNGQTWGGTNSTGIYIGPSGIQLGTGFKVTNAGKITATGGDFSGTIRCDDLYVKNDSGGYDKITTSSIQSSLSGGAAYRSSGWGNYSSGIVCPTANNLYSAMVSSGSGKLERLRVKDLTCDSIGTSNFLYGGFTYKPKTIAYKDGKNITRTITILAREMT